LTRCSTIEEVFLNFGTYWECWQLRKSPHFTGSLQYKFQFIPIPRLNDISIDGDEWNRGKRFNNVWHEINSFLHRCLSHIIVCRRDRNC
jgi:hypothetical protein